MRFEVRGSPLIEDETVEHDSVSVVSRRDAAGALVVEVRVAPGRGLSWQARLLVATRVAEFKRDGRPGRAETYAVNR